MPDGLATSSAGTVAFDLDGHELVADPAGVLWWPAEATLVVADLHFEKGSAFAERGQLLPPYDTRATLERLATVLDRYAPARVICLGDSFHDGRAGGRMAAADRQRLATLAGARDWVWVTGNHDPLPPVGLGGEVVEEFMLAGLVLRHCAVATETGAEISGHFHPKARVDTKSRRVVRPCFVEDGRRLILPAFGAYTGGLSILDPAVQALFASPFRAHLLGRDRIYSFPSDGGQLVAN